ncbi:MAG: hypothetical protein Kow0042_12220 [Calditrichia bacterium]
MKKVIVGIAFAALLIIIASSCAKKEKIIASVGDEVISLQEFKDVLKRQYNTEDFQSISMENRQKTLDELIENRLKVIKARELKLDEHPDLIRDIQAKEDNLAAQKLYEKEVVDRVVTDEVVRDYFDLKRYEIKAVSIIIGYKDAKMRQAERTKEEALLLARDLVRRLKEGENAEELAASYSDDTRARDTKGVLNPYAPGMYVLEIDQKMAKAGENDVIGPVETDQGVFVIKVLEKRKSTVEPEFEKEESKIKKQIFQKYYRDSANDIYLETTEKYKESLGWGISDEGITQFVEAIKTWLNQPAPQDSQFTEEQRSIVLAHVGDFQFTAGYFIDQFGGRFNRYWGRYNTEEKIKKALDGQIAYQAWVIKARQRNLHKHPEVVREVQRLKNLKLVDLLDRVEIRDKTKITEEELYDYYLNNKDKYMEPRKIHLWEIAVKDEKLANKVYKMALNGTDSFGNLAEKYTEKPAMKKRRGDMGYVSDTPALGEIIKKAFEAGPNKIIGPINQGIFYHIIKTGDIKPERQKKFEEVRHLVEGKLTKDKQNQMRQTMLETLKEQYTPWINQELLENLS